MGWEAAPSRQAGGTTPPFKEMGAEPRGLGRQTRIRSRLPTTSTARLPIGSFAEPERTFPW